MPGSIICYFFSIICLLVLMLFFYIEDNHLTQSDLRILYMVFFAIFTLTITFRPYELPDIVVYRDYYYKVKELQWSFVIKHSDLLGGRTFLQMEGGFLLYTWLVSRITGNSYRMYLMICSIVQSLLFIYGLNGIIKTYSLKNNANVCENKNSTSVAFNVNKYKNNLSILMIFISYFGLYYEGIAIRAAFNISLMMVFLTLILKKKLVLAVIVLTISFSIQRMGLISIALAIILISPIDIKTRKFHAFFALFYSFIILKGLYLKIFIKIAPFILKIIKDTPLSDYSNYINDTLAGAGSIGIGLTDVWRIFLLFLFISSKSFEEKLIRKFVNIYEVGMVVDMIFRTMQGSGRIVDMFTVTQIPLLYFLFEDGFETVRIPEKQLKILISIIILGNVVIVYHSIQVGLAINH